MWGNENEGYVNGILTVLERNRLLKIERIIYFWSIPRGRMRENPEKNMNQEATSKMAFLKEGGGCRPEFRYGKKTGEDFEVRGTKSRTPIFEG